MLKYLSRLLLVGWFIGMVVAVQGMPVQGQAEGGDPSKQYFPTMLRNAPVLAEPPLQGYLGLAVVRINEATELYTLRADGSEVRRLTGNVSWGKKYLGRTMEQRCYMECLLGMQ